MGCFGSVFAGSRQVHFFEKTITLSDRKRWNLNLSMTRPCPMWVVAVRIRLSRDNLKNCPHTGGR